MTISDRSGFHLSLPFLKNRRNVAGLIIQTRNADGAKDEQPENHEQDGLRASAQDLLAAIKAGNEDAVVDALRAAFQILDSEPHDEGEHPNESEDES